MDVRWDNVCSIKKNKFLKQFRWTSTFTSPFARTVFYVSRNAMHRSKIETNSMVNWMHWLIDWLTDWLNWIELNWIELNWIELNWIEMNWIELKLLLILILNWIEMVMKALHMLSFKTWISVIHMLIPLEYWWNRQSGCSSCITSSSPITALIINITNRAQSFKYNNF